jgi:hypothetical protein
MIAKGCLKSALKVSATVAAHSHDPTKLLIIDSQAAVPVEPDSEVQQGASDNHFGRSIPFNFGPFRLGQLKRHFSPNLLQ